MEGTGCGYRIWKERRLWGPLGALGGRGLVGGAGGAGARLTKGLARSRQWRVVGRLDDGLRKHQRHIRNIAVLGVNTFGWTFATHKQPLPALAPHVRLSAPSGAIWTWNDASETELIEGSATEFCQVVTQVRNIADTRLKVAGEAATRWMAIAQCFAGPPETPPAPGSRFRESVPG